MKQWLKQVLLAVDQLLNAIIGGWADETVSSRAWRRSSVSTRWDRTRRLIDAVFGWFGSPDHCFESYTAERLRTQFPPELRDGVAALTKERPGG